MKKRFFSLLLALCLPAAWAVPALAAEGQPDWRLTRVTVTSDGVVVDTTLDYGAGGSLPTRAQREDEVFTMEYDEAGRITLYTSPGYTQQSVYNDAGQLAETVWQSAEQVRTVYTYNEAGLVSRAEQTATDTSSVRDYTYDEHGNMTSQSVATDGGEPAVSTYTYEYDDAGLAVSQTYDVTQPWGQFTGTYTYTYDDAGRRVGESYDDGEIRYYYMPLLAGTWSRQIWTDFDGGTSEDISLSLTLEDSAGQQVLSWMCAMTGEPTLEYDDNGCLVRAADADGNMIELSYEPVA